MFKAMQCSLSRNEFVFHVEQVTECMIFIRKIGSRDFIDFIESPCWRVFRPKTDQLANKEETASKLLLI